MTVIFIKWKIKYQNLKINRERHEHGIYQYVIVMHVSGVCMSAILKMLTFKKKLKILFVMEKYQFFLCIKVNNRGLNDY